MNNSYRRPFKLINKIQHYEWGTRDAEAFIPHFLGAPVAPGLPYAELWIGAHPTAPSDIVVEGKTISLHRAIAEAPIEILGEETAKRYGNTLPFLLKVLSAADALSIQTHPNREQARKLHASDPAHYPDDNHKPEIAIALDSLTAIAGFRPADDIVSILRGYPELRDLAGDELMARVISESGVSERIENLKRLYAVIMKCSTQEATLSRVTANIVSRLRAKRTLSVEERHVMEQYNRHGADVGLFSFLFLNSVTLASGQAIFTDAGVPHAYIRGNIVECMANSDNVVRAGLTNKFKDVNTLLEILTYRFAAFPIINEERKADRVVYRTSAKEFEVTMHHKGAGSDEIVGVAGKPIVVLLTEGSLTVSCEEGDGWSPGRFVRGESFLMPACSPRWRMSCSENSSFFSVTIP
jgi:mannose-6-phosphate isomerase